jgi:hypothetical protein
MILSVCAVETDRARRSMKDLPQAYGRRTPVTSVTRGQAGQHAGDDTNEGRVRLAFNDYDG